MKDINNNEINKYDAVNDNDSDDDDNDERVLFIILSGLKKQINIKKRVNMNLKYI